MRCVGLKLRQPYMFKWGGGGLFGAPVRGPFLGSFFGDPLLEILLNFLTVDILL